MGRVSVGLGLGLWLRLELGFCPHHRLHFNPLYNLQSAFYPWPNVRDQHISDCCVARFRIFLLYLTFAFVSLQKLSTVI